MAIHNQICLRKIFLVTTRQFRGETDVTFMFTFNNRITKHEVFFHTKILMHMNYHNFFQMLVPLYKEFLIIRKLCSKKVSLLFAYSFKPKIVYLEWLKVDQTVLLKNQNNCKQSISEEIEKKLTK